MAEESSGSVVSFAVNVFGLHLDNCGERTTTGRGVEQVGECEIRLCEAGEAFSRFQV